MKYLLTLFLGVVSLVSLSAQTSSTGSGQAADADYAAFQALMKKAPPGMPKDIGAEKYLTWQDGQRQEIKAAALAFQAAYPTDARRWELLMTAVKSPPYFIASFGPDVETKGPGAIVPDQAAAAAWRQQGNELTKAMLASTDASPALREDAEWGLFAKDFRATTQAKRSGQPYDYSGFAARFEAHAAKYPDMGDVLVRRANDYLGALDANEAGAAAPIWAKLAAGSPNETLREAAAKKGRLSGIMSRPLEMKFTAVDGREVDLAALRGKVVLIDFWATWCGPCIAELPNVKKVYAAYHDKGFEIVGISLENGKLLSSDKPEQTAAKHVAAKKVLTDFTAKENMPWPQYYDGKWWKNDISTQYDINGIPAMFLLDQSGKIVSTNARGEALEREVKRLLKL